MADKASPPHLAFGRESVHRGTNSCAILKCLLQQAQRTHREEGLAGSQERRNGVCVAVCRGVARTSVEALHARVQEQALGSDKGLRRGAVLPPVGSLLLPCHISEVSK